MLTFFTTAKPFTKQNAFPQRNALRSWKSLAQGVEVILFGEEQGAQEVCEELSLRHEPYVERNEFGSKRLDFMFRRAQAVARHELLCYINCDIILLQDFCAALERVSAAHARFLMVGRRWDLDMQGLVDFDAAEAADRLRRLAQSQAVQRGPDAIDYFAFRRGLPWDLPPLVVGRIWWDHFLAWRAVRLRAALVDASSCDVALHQNHDYG